MTSRFARWEQPNTALKVLAQLFKTSHIAAGPYDRRAHKPTSAYNRGKMRKSMDVALEKLFRDTAGQALLNNALDAGIKMSIGKFLQGQAGVDRLTVPKRQYSRGNTGRGRPSPVWRGPCLPRRLQGAKTQCARACAPVFLYARICAGEYARKYAREYAGKYPRKQRLCNTCATLVPLKST